MTIDLMPLVIAWVALTAVVAGLALWRLMEGLHDDTGIHVIEGSEAELQSKSSSARRMDRLEAIGKTLTAASAVMIAIIGLAYLYNVWHLTRG
jgi:hypothetical protein